MREYIPNDKVILARLKRFYSNEKLTIENKEKAMKRKMEKKANHRTYAIL